MIRQPRILHCTSEPLHFFGRSDELALLDGGLSASGPSVAALVGPGGQGKTAIVQHWLHRLAEPLDGLFLWSFYRGKDADLCLREWLAYAEGPDTTPQVSAAYCVDRLLTVLRRERWAVVLDGAEVVQYEDGPWRGRFVHPDLARLLEELSSEPTPGVVAVTSRFEPTTLLRRPCFQLVSLDRLDSLSARNLLLSVGVVGSDEELDAVSARAGRHAKAVELLGTWLKRFRAGLIDHGLDEASPVVGTELPDEESSVAGVLALFQRDLEQEAQDLLSLTTAFREPPREGLLLDYLKSGAVKTLLHSTWGRTYLPFAERGPHWLPKQIDELVHLRLLERVGPGEVLVIDAHPLVRRGFEHVAGPAGHRQNALARAGFLRARPDRRRPETLEEAREIIEMFHAHCDAGLWNEADSALLGLENPKHRLLAPAVELQLLLRFFPGGDWRKPPLWPGFGRWRSLAICMEMLGQFRDALEAYRPADAALRGDSLIALGRLRPLLETPAVPAPWQTLWQSYRCHALCLAGRVEEGVALAWSLVPVDVYEWVHVFECLLRADALHLVDLKSVLFRPPSGEHRWADLARRRMRADYLRRRNNNPEELGAEYAELLNAYDRAGLPLERTITRLGYAAWLLERDRIEEARAIHDSTQEVINRSGLTGLLLDGWSLAERIAVARGAWDGAEQARGELRRIGQESEIRGPRRP